MCCNIDVLCPCGGSSFLKGIVKLICIKLMFVANVDLQWGARQGPHAWMAIPRNKLGMGLCNHLAHCWSWIPLWWTWGALICTKVLLGCSLVDMVTTCRMAKQTHLEWWECTEGRCRVLDGAHRGWWQKAGDTEADVESWMVDTKARCIVVHYNPNSDQVDIGYAYTHISMYIYMYTHTYIWLEK